MTLMSVTNVQPTDKSIFEDAALETGIAAPFVEKDWYVTQVISALSAIETDGYEIIFSGGTALSKAHGLLQRFSEDIDFRVLTENTGRKALSAYKNTVIEKLRESGFGIEEHQIKARDGNRYFSIDPVESAADKLSALAWRIPDRVRGGKYDDPAIVRYIHDLAVLKDAAMKNDDFARLVLSSMSHDDRRSKNNPDFAGLPVDEKFKQMFEILDTDQEYRREYERFVKGVSYAPEGDVPGYDAALDAVRLLAKSVMS
ncbi:MAG: nucleotidyl transferase AbiEii/AbiGii toxin family protein [Alphaproteobacteria bacterium]|nr:nucleotidyl transferase AbiEii/AbiGii toxin family protein [Alphaproteobacteria bacterium]